MIYPSPALKRFLRLCWGVPGAAFRDGFGVYRQSLSEETEMSSEEKKPETKVSPRKKFTSKKPAPPSVPDVEPVVEKNNDGKEEDPSAGFSWTKWE